MDLDYRKQWDQYVKALYEQECNGQTVVYWEVKYPFPMSNRDVSFPQACGAFLLSVYNAGVGVLP
uniref:Phosphatidylcholine transfer protein n=1 Tax=Macaca nemestrina TaxID=9545 RepID=A0A2K6CMP9_MACNE